MKILYLDCASGVSGDMLLGALVDCGLDPKLLRSRLAQLPLKGYTLSFRDAKRQGIGARKATVKINVRQHAHRGLKEIDAIVDKSKLPEHIRKTAMTIFRKIIQVEARIHRISEQRVHLHEVGAIDAIVDIVGTVIGIDALVGLAGTREVGRVVCSPLNVGHGTVRMAHGTLPVPAPATVALLKGIPVYSDGPAGERVTPTGAAIVSTLAASFGPSPAMTIEGVGYGAGSRDDKGFPNVLRVMVGESWKTQEASTGEITVIECTIDDMNPQGYGYVMERLFDAGAHEVFYTPVQMKKGRPGILVTAIGPTGQLQQFARILFEETTTIGLRHRTVDRIELSREIRPVKTPWGRVNIKVSSLNGRVMQVTPEYDDCRRLAARKKIPLKDVQAAAQAAFGETL